MTVLTLDEIRAYCEPLSIRVEAGPVPNLYFERCADCRVYVGRFAAAASAAFDTAAAILAPERGDFRGAVVWLTARQPTFENDAAAFGRVRRGLGADAPLDAAPGHRFGPGAAEFADALILVGFLMTFGWDAVWVPAHGEYLMAVNHDNLMDFAVRGGGGRWDADRQELFDNLDFRHWPQMTRRYCPG
jgi:hypothetical protein